MNKHLVKRLLQYAKPYSGYLAGALLFALVHVAMILLGPVLMGKAIDGIIAEEQVDFAAVARMLLVLLLTIAAGAFFQWLMALCTNKAAQLTVCNLRKDVFLKLLRVPIRYIDSHAHGDMLNRIVNDIDLVSDGLLQGFTQLFTGVVMILGTLGIMLSINIVIALVVVALTPISLLIAAFIAKRTHNTFFEQTKIQGELSGYLAEMLGGQKIVKTFGHEAQSINTFESLNRKLYPWGLKAQIYPAFTNPLTRFVNGLVYAAVGVAGALSAISGGVSVGQLSSFLSYANQYTKPFNDVTAILAQLQTAYSSARRVFETLDAQEEPEEQENGNPVRVKGQVDITDVSFRYEKDRPLIERFSLKVRPGQRIAIVGPTGCGKTTLINLLMRFYDIDSGLIAVDGINIQSIPRKNLRVQFGMVLQETWLTQATIRENIAYGRPEATLEEVMTAAKAAHAHGFISRLENGYDTIISENGDNLSQGQKQLLCIARVMLLDPPMLILDEATSSIDTRTEIKVQRAFARMMEGRTSFIVAHRLSTIQEADMILVMDKGHIIEQGTHRALLEKQGFYANLYNSQFASVKGIVQ